MSQALPKPRRAILEYLQAQQQPSAKESKHNGDPTHAAPQPTIKPISTKHLPDELTSRRRKTLYAEDGESHGDSKNMLTTTMHHHRQPSLPKPDWNSRVAIPRGKASWDMDADPPTHTRRPSTAAQHSRRPSAQCPLAAFLETGEVSVGQHLPKATAPEAAVVAVAQAAVPEAESPVPLPQHHQQEQPPPPAAPPSSTTSTPSKARRGFAWLPWRKKHGGSVSSTPTATETPTALVHTTDVPANTPVDTPAHIPTTPSSPDSGPPPAPISSTGSTPTAAAFQQQLAPLRTSRFAPDIARVASPGAHYPSPLAHPSPASIIARDVAARTAARRDAVFGTSTLLINPDRLGPLAHLAVTPAASPMSLPPFTSSSAGLMRAMHDMHLPLASPRSLRSPGGPSRGGSSRGTPSARAPQERTVPSYMLPTSAFANRVKAAQEEAEVAAAAAAAAAEQEAAEGGAFSSDTPTRKTVRKAPRLKKAATQKPKLSAAAQAAMAARDKVKQEDDHVAALISAVSDARRSPGADAVPAVFGGGILPGEQVEAEEEDDEQWLLSPVQQGADGVRGELSSTGSTSNTPAAPIHKLPEMVASLTAQGSVDPSTDSVTDDGASTTSGAESKVPCRRWPQLIISQDYMLNESNSPIAAQSMARFSAV